MAKRNRNIEDSEQRIFFQLAPAIIYSTIGAEYTQLLYAGMGGQKFTTKLQGYRAKLLGNKRGVPDISLDYPIGSYHGLRIELKRPKTAICEAGKVSKEQKEMIALLNKIGYSAHVAYGSQEALKILQSYLKGEL